MVQSQRPLFWVASAKKDLMDMPEDVRDTFGYALHLAQIGGKHAQAKPLKGFGSADLVEIVEDFKGDTFRAVYTVRCQEKIYVVNSFQKKATQGIRTPKPDMDKIHERLKWAERHAKGVIE